MPDDTSPSDKDAHPPGDVTPSSSAPIEREPDSTIIGTWVLFLSFLLLVLLLLLDALSSLPRWFAR